MSLPARLPTGTCKTPFVNGLGCYDAIASLGLNATGGITNKTVKDAGLPEGCVFIKNEQDGTAEAVFNQAGKAAGNASGCPGSAAKTATQASPLTTVSVGMSLSTEATVTLSGPADVWFGVGLDASAMEVILIIAQMSIYGNNH